MDYQIAIPSYKRSKKLVKETLETLHSNLISFSKVWVFVVEAEYDEYSDAIRERFPEFPKDHLVVGLEGLKEQRMFIVDYFDEGAHVLNLDDDVERVCLQYTTYPDLDTFIRSAFEDCVKHKAFIWSVYPTFNHFFRKKTRPLTTELCMMIGGFHGLINRRNLFSLTIDQKEDVERSIQHFIHDGVVLRYNQVGFKTKFFSVGGYGGKTERLIPNQLAVSQLMALYPEYGKFKERKDGRHEFVLKPIKQRESIAELTKIVVHQTYPASVFEPLYKRLNELTISLKNKNTSRRGFGAHRATTFGLVRQRKTGKTAMSHSSKKYPDVWKLVQDVGTALGYTYSSVHLNHNVVCPKHKDGKNASFSMLVSFGDYKGCNIVVEGVEYDARHTPIVFNGAYLEHWNTPLISGTKYSLVFYHHSECKIPKEDCVESLPEFSNDI